jgi:hypothetical protein
MFMWAGVLGVSTHQKSLPHWLGGLVLRYSAVVLQRPNREIPVKNDKAKYYDDNFQAVGMDS